MLTGDWCCQSMRQTRKILTFDVWFWPQWLGLYTPEELKYTSYSYKVLSVLICCIDCKTITLKSLDSVNHSQIPVFCLKNMAGLIWFLWQILGVEQICCSAQYRTQFLRPILIYHIYILCDTYFKPLFQWKIYNAPFRKISNSAQCGRFALILWRLVKGSFIHVF